MTREPDLTRHTYELSNDDLHSAIRTFLGIPESQQMHVEFNCYGNSADAEVTVPIRRAKQ